MDNITGQYLMNLVLNGVLIGIIYGLMALGLTLIFSVLGIVSFAHGEFYMIGGYVVFNLLKAFTGLEPMIAILLAGATTFIIGVIFEKLFLQPMVKGDIERPGEYAILLTFGLAFFLQHVMIGLVGPFPTKVDRFYDFINLDWGWLRMNKATVWFFEMPISSSRLIATGVAVVLTALVIWFMNKTWTGRGLQAVSQDRQAASVVGINPAQMNTLAFGLGTMLAGMSGAALVTVFAWVPWIGMAASSKAFIIIVLGGMGSMPGAILGGLVLGIVESLGAGLYPDPSKALAYKDAFGLLVFVLVLLIKPTGFFGRKL
ncbi:MAG TPA: branched-chain amino acid ABC transporter permease [Anaerolineales bacterium]|nr:branched-chain amino acid ABC transporter permease [Anaerolineales bacterium]